MFECGCSGDIRMRYPGFASKFVKMARRVPAGVAAADKASRDAKAKGLETIEKFTVKNAKRNGVLLGNGSFGSVEQFEVDGVICAGKKVHGHLVQRGNQGQELMVKKYYDECCLLSDLRHPHVIQFLGICWVPDSEYPVLLMELLHGNLHDLLEKTPNIPLYLKVSILQDVARGLIYLHCRNPPVIHRDLNAGNVLLNTEMRAKIADVGNSRVVDVQQAIKLSAIPGCPVYMPPEAFDSPPRYDTSLDMFSFGHLALFTATQVFPGDLKPIKDPNKKTKALSEVKRRQDYIDILYVKVTGDEGASNKKGSAEVGTRISEKDKTKIKDPPLVQFVKECLDDYGHKRPTAKLALKKLNDLNAAIDNPYRGLSRPQLETSLAEKETRIQQQSSEIERLKAQLQVESKKGDLESGASPLALSHQHTLMATGWEWYAAIDKLPSSLLSGRDMEVKQWIIKSKAKHIEILVTGTLGSGKSSLVNALCGRTVMPEGNGSDPVTTSVENYTFTTSEGYDIVVWDSPGLEDGTGNEPHYLAEMKKKCSNVDIVIYCIKTGYPRGLGHEHYTVIQMLTSTFGVEWWKNSVFVLTFANILETMHKYRTRDPNNIEKNFNDSIAKWEGEIREVINAVGIPQEIAKNIPIELASHSKRPHLLGRQYWLSHLWFALAQRMKRKSQPLFVKN